ncbi:MAG: HEAT repeat domain-containing protein [Crinalium sp.]
MSSSKAAISIFTTDNQLIVRSWDDWLSKATGVNADEACGKKLTVLVPDLETRGLLKLFEQVLTKGTIETIAPTVDRYLIPCPPLTPSQYFERMQQRVTISPLQSSDRIIGTIVTIEDVTAKLNRECELAQQLSSHDENTRIHAVELLTTEASPESQPSIVTAMTDENWRVRQKVVDGLALRGGEQTADMLLRTLREQHQDLGVLNSVLQVMALSNTDTIPALIECLNDPDEDLRIYAALTLGEQQDVRAIPALIKALEDPNANVRYHAVDALSQLRAEEAVDALTTLAESRNFFVSFPAIDALRRIGNPAIAPRLVPLLADQILREPAAIALGELGNEEVVAPLVELLNTQTAPARVIINAIANLYYRYEKVYGEGNQIIDLFKHSITQQGIDNLLSTIRQAKHNEFRSFVLTLSWLDGEAVETAMTQLLDYPAARDLAKVALVRYGKRVTKLLIAQLAAADLATREAAIVTLGRIGDPSAVPALMEILTTIPELVIPTAGALAQIGDRRAFEALLSLIGHTDAGVRQAAISALDSLGHPDMAGRMVQLLSDPDPLVRESAVKIAGYFAYPECEQLLFAACCDPIEIVRTAAIEHIAYLENENVLTTIAHALDHETPKVRTVAAKALEHLDSNRTFPLLLSALKDPEPWVRYYAARSIGRHGYVEAIDALAQLAQYDEANHVRSCAVSALGRIGTERSVAILAPLALVSDSEGDITSCAIAALGMIKHPIALPTLLAVARNGETVNRLTAIRALGECNGVGVAEALQCLAELNPQAVIVQTAIEALARLANTEDNRTSQPSRAIAALIDLTAEPTRREACVTALAKLREPQIAAIATGLNHPLSGVRRAVVDALTRLKHPQASAFLETALEDSDGIVRLAAVTALGYLGNRSAERKLVILARTDPDPAVRRAAQKVLQM